LVDEDNEIVDSRNILLSLFQNGFQVLFRALLRMKAHAIPDRGFTLHFPLGDGSVSLGLPYPLLVQLQRVRCATRCGRTPSVPTSTLLTGTAGNSYPQ
jgi:hypothetical protein